MEPKSTKNLCKIDLGKFWALEAVSGTRRDALGTGPGRQKKTPGSIFGASGAGQERVGTGQKSPGAGLGTLPDDFGAIPERA